MRIRLEHSRDIAAVRAVNLAAFETPVEADLVEALREQASPLVSLVAEDVTGVVGHILFSTVTLDGPPHPRVMGLAPMAVLPVRQRQGIGASLVRNGLERCRQIGAGGVVVLGHVEYYPRFGFVPASRFGLRCQYDVPDAAFMALELVSGAFAGRSGTVHYHPAFPSV
jgi:putative acetyltransferase